MSPIKTIFYKDGGVLEIYEIYQVFYTAPHWKNHQQKLKKKSEPV